MDETMQDLLAALTIIDLLTPSAWHKTGHQQYWCNGCGGLGELPKSITHHPNCIVKKGEDLVNKYRSKLEE